MRGNRRWWWRAGLALIGYLAIMGVTVLLHNNPDPVAIALVVALLVAAGSVLLDATDTASASWRFPAPSAAGLGRTDPRTAAHVRLLENHLTEADPTPALRDRLRQLATQVLGSRHDLELADPRAAELLGPELTAVLADPPRRLPLRVTERLVHRIESL